MEDSKAMTTPMSTTTALDADEEGEHVDQKEYQSMIESVLDSDEAGHPILGMSVCSLSSVSEDFGLRYSASSSLALHGFSDADFAGCWFNRRSTSGTC
jgi:hypothetical protein